MSKYYAFDFVNGEHELFETAKEAKETAERYFNYYAQNAACDGWPEDLANSIGWGEMKEIVGKEKVVADKKDFTDEEWADEGYSSDYDKIVEYELEAIKP